VLQVEHNVDLSMVQNALKSNLNFKKKT